MNFASILESGTLKTSLWLLLNVYRHWISGEESPRCPAAEQCGVAQTRAPALYWNTETVREYPVRLAQAVWYPKMETVGLLLFKIFFQDQISTHKTFLCLKDGAEQSHLLYSCKEGLDGCLWTSQLVLSVPGSTTISSSCFLSSQGGEISFQL